MKCFLKILSAINLILIFLLVCPVNAETFSMKITEDTISIQADQVPLKDILKKITQAGIKVYIDPQLNPDITASFENREIQHGLDSILKTLNHIYIWKSVNFPSNFSLTKQMKLAEIQIFKPGKKSRMEPLKPMGKNAVFSTAIETKVIIKGNRVFVPVVLGFEENEVNTTLVFDTGATSIVLHQDVADKLNLKNLTDTTGRGVGGIKVDIQATVLDYVKVGPHEKKNLRINVIEYQGTAVDLYNGLLGMNFLRGLEYSIDFEKQVIRWKP